MVTTPHPYGVFLEAANYAVTDTTVGKGVARHAAGRPYEEQPLMGLCRFYGIGGMLYQAAKKMDEAQRLPSQAAMNELRGAVCHAIAAMCLLNEQNGHTLIPALGGPDNLNQFAVLAEEFGIGMSDKTGGSNQ